MEKAVVFIVEGATDKKALENIFKKIYRHKEIHFEFTCGDLSSDENIDVENVESEIYKFVDEYRKDKKLKTSDIWQIVHIFDMDGAYIDDTHIVQGNSPDFIYSTNNIYCKNIKKVKNRNEHKRKLMDYLLKCQNIKNIPYKCYYLSSNLDHALYSKLNLTDDEKTEYANAFYELFMGREQLFINFLRMEVVNGVPDSFPKSWKYIKEGLHSLERHTNLNLYFKDNPVL